MKNKKIILYINYLIVFLSVLTIVFNLIQCDYFNLIALTISFLTILVVLISTVMLNSGEKLLKIVLQDKNKKNIDFDDFESEEDDEVNLSNKCLELVKDVDKGLGFEDLLEQKIIKLADALQIVASITYVKKGNELVVSSCYALAKSEQKSKLSIEEGLTGQVIKDKKPIEVSITDQISLEIISGLGKSKPNYLYILPLFEGEEIKGAVEIATFIKLSDTRVEFLIEALTK